MRTTVSSKGQIVLPAELREQDSIRAGEQFEVERMQAGHYLLKKLPLRGSSGVLDWLLACPEKNWFQPIESESTDDL
jgi:AbrB family looped-hinge helix DNA binding protein